MGRCFHVVPAHVWVTTLVFLLLCAARDVVAGVHCPRCSARCELSVEEGERSRHCWKVECEKVCVPKVVFPWQNRRAGNAREAGCTEIGCSGVGCTSCTTGDGCGHVKHNGAFVIKVHKLKKHKFTCPQCEYSWDVKKPSCTDGCTASCDEVAEDASGGDAEDDPTADGEADSAGGSDAAADDEPTAADAPDGVDPEASPPSDEDPSIGPSLGSPQAADRTIPGWEHGVQRYRQLQERPIVFKFTDLPSKVKNASSIVAGDKQR